jgi:hypothetical protein
VSSIWTGADFALGEGTSFAGAVSLQVSAPSVNDYTLRRLVFTPSLRSMLSHAGTPVPYWWTSAEVILDAVFATDGVDVAPDITGGDERLLYVSQLTPHLAYGSTQDQQSIVWRTDPTEVQNHTARRATTLGAFAPAVFFHFNVADQHGVFTTGVSLANRAFAVNLSVRALWSLNF